MSHAMRRAKRHEVCPTGGTFAYILNDSAGNVLALAAAGMVVLMGLVGGGVDMARAYQAERRLQAACDAGVLAGRRAVVDDGFDTPAVAQANQYFNTNYDGDRQGTSNEQFTPVSPDEGNTVNGTATATLPTVIMSVFGFNQLDLSVTCSASMGVGNSDIMFVLDNTGSMDWAPDGETGVDDEETRLFALQQAMKAFYDTVAEANSGGNARIRFGFVPYSSTVNVGDLLMAEDSSYVSDSITISSREPVNWSAVVATWTGTGTPTNPQNGNWPNLINSSYPTKYSDLTACDNAKPADETTWTTYDSEVDSVNNTFDSTRGANGQKVTATGTQNYQRKSDFECQYKNSNPAKGWYVNRRYITREITSYTYEARDPIVVTTYNAAFANWLYRPVTRSVGTFKTANAQALVSSSSGYTRWNTATTWNGCIQERQTTPASSFTFASLLTGITPGEALDLDIDAAPTGDDATKWKPLWGNATYRRYTTAASLSGETSSMSSSTACPDEAQLLAEMEEDDFDAYVDALDADGGTYHDIGLLWGARLSSPTGIFADNVTDEPGNGGTVSRHLIFMTDGELDPSPTSNSAYGIESVDRRVTTDGTDGTAYTNHRSRYLAVCEAIKARGIRLWVIAFGASVDLSADLLACASPDSAFKADDASTLNTTFQEIANQVGELRIVQ